MRQQRRRLGHQVRLGLRPVLGLPRVRREPSTGAPLAAAHPDAPAWMRRHVRWIKHGMDHEVWLG